jgi:FkbM family methyltransferase
LLLARRLVYYLRSVFTLWQGVRNWPDLLRLALHTHRPVTLVLKDGSRYRVRALMDAWIVKETNLDRDYERLGSHLENGWNVLDVGAGQGDFTIYCARRIPHGIVHAYEPSAESVALLEENIRLNAVRNVQVFAVALSGGERHVELDTSGGVAVQYRAIAPSDSNRADRHVVAAVSLPEAVALLPGGRCDFLKMDCEGAEFDTLLSMEPPDLTPVKRICLEYHDGVTQYSHRDLVARFRGLGWRVRVEESAVQRNLGFLYIENPELGA